MFLSCVTALGGYEDSAHDRSCAGAPAGLEKPYRIIMVLPGALPFIVPEESSLLRGRIQDLFSVEEAAKIHNILYKYLVPDSGVTGAQV